MKKITNLILAFCFVSVLSLRAQVTFDKQLIYAHGEDIAEDYNALQQTADKGYLTCRGVLDSVGTNEYGYCEILKTDSAGSSSWNKRILLGSITGVRMPIGLAVMQSKDKDYMAAVSIYKTNKWSEIVLVKMDSVTNLVWCKKYKGEGASTSYCVKQTTDKGYIACGVTIDTITNKQFAYIFKTDSLGNYTWGKKCLRSIDTVGAFITSEELPGQGYLVGGCSGNSAMVVKLDLNGNLLWDKEIFRKGAVFYSAVKTSDNNFFMTGLYNDSVVGQECSFYIKLDQSGNILWLKGANQNSNPFYGSYGSVARAMPNCVVVSGYISDPIPATYLGKMDLNGNFIWCNEYRYTFHTFNYTPNSLVTTTDGGFAISVLAGTFRGGLANFSTELLKTDSLGKLSCDGASHLFALTNLTYSTTSNAAVSVSGSAISYTPVLSNFIVNDTTICISPAVLGIEKINTTSFNLSQNYPNPFGNQTSINYTLTEEARNVSFEVMNILGEKIIEQKENNNIGDHTIRLNNMNLTKGIYFYSLLVDRNKITRKMIVQ